MACDFAAVAVVPSKVQRFNLNFKMRSTKLSIMSQANVKLGLAFWVSVRGEVEGKGQARQINRYLKKCLQQAHTQSGLGKV